MPETAAQERVTPPSATESSFFMMRSNFRTKLVNSSSFPAGTATTASQRGQMTLSNWPPRRSAMRSAPTCSMAPYSARPMSWTALPRPLSISAPEWPPCRPDRLTEKQLSPPSACRAAGRKQSARRPPAQATVNTPSSSESRFSSRRPFRSEQSSAAAPSMPVSSSMVNTTSSGGWGRESSARMASAVATAIQSSPPSEVLSAQT